MTKKTLFFALFSLFFALPVHATVMGIAPGDLIKLQDDHDPKTVEDKVVYYFDKDWKRHPFPNQKIFQSWYKDFSGVKELSKEDMAQIALGNNITYRPGTRLVKIPSIPKVYAVEPGGRLRWIETESVAKALYGDAWNQRVDDVSEAFFTNYHEGAPLTVPVWPSGTLVRRTSDTALYVIDGLGRHYLSPTVSASLHVNDAYVFQTNDLSLYADLGPVPANDWKYLDTSQVSFIDTQPRPAFDFPVSGTQAVAAGQTGQTLAAFRVTTGMPMIIRGVTVTLDGALWNGDVPRFSDLHFADVYGNDLFGIKQLSSQPGATSETIEFTGAYTMPTDTIGVIQLLAKTASPLGAGNVTVTIPRDGLQLADGGNGEPWTEFYPRAAFPVFTVTPAK